MNRPDGPAPDAGASSVEPRPRRRFLTWLREETLLALELAALVGFAVSQPVLDLFGRAPDVFVFEGADRRDILAFALLFTAVAIGAAVLPGFVVGLVSRRARLPVHVAMVGLLVGLVAVHVLDRYTGLPAAAVAILAAASAGGAALLRVRSRLMREWLRFASPAPVLFLALFLLVSPVSKLVFPKSVAALDVAAVRDAPPVVLVVLDEFPLVSLADRDGRVDADLFPNFARLADRSLYFTGASTLSPATWHMIPSILTGKLPREDTVPLASDYPDNLFTMLAGQYRLEVFEAITRLCPPELCPIDRQGGGFHAIARQGLRALRDLLTPGESENDPNASLVEDQAAGASPDSSGIEFDAFDRSQPERFTRFLDALRTAEEPAVHYLHLLLPHTPWRYLPSGRTYPFPKASPGSAGARWSDQAWPTMLNRQRHILQVQYTDGLVGALLDTLDQRGLLDPALVIVTADHGVAFTPGEPVKGNKESELTRAILPEMMFVPLFVKLPGQHAGEVRDDDVYNIDILPTVADVLGIDPPFAMDGQSLLGPHRRSDTRPWYQSYDSDFFGVNRGRRYDIPEGEVRPDLARLGVDVLAPYPGPLRPYQIGPYADLVGRRLADVDVTTPVDARAVVDQGAEFRSVNLDQGVVPALLTGRITRGDPPADSAVAAAVNGTVAGVSPLFVHLERLDSFALLVPESLFRDGTNDLELYLVRGTGSDATFAPLSQG